MSISYVVTPEMLSKFKEPFGILIEGSFSQTMNQLKDIVTKEKPAVIISIGDTVSRNLHEHHIIPQLSITDNQSMRKKLEPQIFPDKTIVQIKNPQGTITQEAINAIKNALQSQKQIQIIVDGEEDLLTLIAVLYAPENALVVYGQPQKGIVTVRVTKEKKADAQRIWKTMKPVNEKKEK
jgi:GTP-dependent dephospho-CoA kinase